MDHTIRTSTEEKEDTKNPCQHQTFSSPGLSHDPGFGRLSDRLSDKPLPIVR
ncbi:hypothetical protein Pla100_61210 [Neorhodopirellula pilleata]|uniref:Uncharacterized protein n=1 Tax=Neorhodopirellula pilleata TaxID=2714738 RepID=A0A5C5ZGB1_9BACT|nr:hypothetical protein Pla100_61210 [Neorhodopirellula pilleata]